MFKNLAMDVEEFRVHGKDVVDYICKYLATLENRSVIPNVTPGYLSNLMPDEAPEGPENWSDIMEDMEKLIMPGITHWQHPRFHAYFPAGNSFPSIMGDMISDAIGCIGFSWAASPACTELEIIMLDWLAKMMRLPRAFMHSSNLGGGGVIQGSASDCILVSMLSARYKKIKDVKTNIPMKEHLNKDKERCIDGAILTKLVGYCSSLAHSSVEKAGMISFVKIRQLDVDANYSLRGATLETAIKNDLENKMFPFFVCATLGTTGCCSFDNLQEIGAVCCKYKVWLHLDASYAGSSFICPEFQHYLKGIEYVDSMGVNPNKFMLVNFDCSILWVRKSALITDSMNVDPVYLQHKHSTKAVDFRHWGVPLSRRFRALKLWFVIRAYGVEGLQNYIRNHVYLASEFANLVRGNDSFEVVGREVLGLVCFRLKASSKNLLFTKQELNSLNQCLIRTINESGKLHMTPSVVKDKYILRFCVCSEHATIQDIKVAWNTIESVADDILKAQSGLKQWKYHMSRVDVANKDQIYSVAEKLVNSVVSPQGCQNHAFGRDSRQIKSDKPVGRERFQFIRKIPQHRKNGNIPILNLSEEKQKSVDVRLIEDKEFKEEIDTEVFICEKDLGVGSEKKNVLSQMLKLACKQGTYSPNFFQSLCFCNELKESDFGNQRISPRHNKCTSSVSDYGVVAANEDD